MPGCKAEAAAHSLMAAWIEREFICSIKNFHSQTVILAVCMPSLAADLKRIESLYDKEESAQLLALCESLMQDGAAALRPEETGRVQYLAGCACESLHRFGPATSYFQQAAETYEELGQERQALQAELGRIYASRAKEPFGQLIFEAERCQLRAQQASWNEEAAEALTILAAACRARHDYQQAIKHCRDALSLLQNRSPATIFSRASCTLAWSLTALGNHAEADGHMRAALELLRGTENSVRLRREMSNFAFQAWCRGEVERARVLTMEQIESALRDADLAQLGMARFNLAVYETHIGDWQEARRLALQAWQRPAGQHGAVFESAVLMLLGLLALHLKQPAESLNYMRLAQAAMRDLDNDEADLLDYYLSLGLLAAATPAEALESWERRRELMVSVENQIEAVWLQRALGALCAQDYAPLLADAAAVRSVAGRMSADLAQWQSRADAELSSLREAEAGEAPLRNAAAG